jgi:hypothetical protein
MSTNFYWTADAKSPMAVFGDIHIGKRSGGWSFSFHAVRYEGSKEQDSWMEVAEGLSVKVKIQELPAVSIKSYQDWKKVISENGGTIIDEYGAVMATDEFFEMQEVHLHPKTGTWGKPDNRQPLLNHFDEISKRSNGYGPVNPDRDWKDEEGYSFTATTFS